MRRLMAMIERDKSNFGMGTIKLRVQSSVGNGLKPFRTGVRRPRRARSSRSEFGVLNPHSAFPACPAGRRIPQSKGFTLIEVILIMIIVGILAAFLMPRIDFTLPTTVSVDGAAYIVASDIRYAQECAMANRVSKAVRFVIGQSAYTFDATVPPTNSLDPSGQLPSGVTITNNSTNPYIVTFNSLGEPIVGGAGWVEVTGGGQTKRITVENYTGKASIP